MARLASRLQNPPTFIDHQCGRFLIMDAPTDANLSLYLEEARRLGVGTWVRCCEGCSYDPAKVAGAGISEHDLSFPDGEAPPLPLISRWLDLCFADEATVAAGVDAGDAVDFIRKRRRGAINKVQLKYVLEYKPTRRKDKCVLM
ncbi:hypothetical protein EMIHUDRAFT_452021 [Emiliania huxleyi CCMP1516]|uniref:Uncharacterized protein n=2 Tax=Emiliania huxleyi TaxID=2903 RepID=A0A0D3IPB6_EMIH1|nr:hypothetical protein EMIHUDRAFT_452021 [Emiliania huxleyi CCMP1516]EOD13101.1 hypothetical protein EMIHUDRAFT_452021 [Emiliania huxleyi CCMP1516]|eukprot:XP_005765530.1 hypothetical protein EMIHUDRAFT_452021 [Emiliania huxleyi CCMP1516]